MERMEKQTAVEWLVEQCGLKPDGKLVIQAKAMEKEQMLDFGDFIIDELEPMAQNREWVEEKYNYFISEEDD